MTISFTYGTGSGECSATLSLVQEKKQPRTFSFGFNESIAEREIDLRSYRISLRSKEKRVLLHDPLDLSVKNFIRATESGERPLIGLDHIMTTTMLLKQITDAYVQ